MMKYRFLMPMLLFLALILTICGCLRNLEVSTTPRLQTEGAVIYAKSGNSNTRICHYNLADGRETLLYDYGANITEPNPAIYPADHTKIILAAKNSAAKYDLYLYDLTTKEKTSQTYNKSNYTDRHPSLDYSGTKLVFQSARSSPTKFYFVDLTSAAEPVTYDSEGGLVPVISPDGTKIAYIKKDSADEKYKLWVYDLDGALEPNPKQITYDHNVYNPAWAADNETLAVETYVSSEGPRFIATIKPFDAEPKLQQVVYSWGKNDDYRHPAWGVTAGRVILFFTGKLLTSDRHALGAVYYDEVVAKGSGAQWYLVASDSDENIKEPAWAPDLTVPTAEDRRHGDGSFVLTSQPISGKIY
jgi:Tol biopolymer transport system component